MRSAVFITAKTKSTRLDGKLLKKLNEQHSVIEFVIKRSRFIKNVDEVVLCTTTDESDQELCEIAKLNGINYFRGSIEDKLDRWKCAASKFKIDHVVCFDADDPFCDPFLMESALTQLKENKLDLITPGEVVCGGFSYAFNASAVETICKTKSTTKTEMMWTFFEGKDLFKIEKLKLHDKLYKTKDFRLTIDYLEDLFFFREFFKLYNPSIDLPLLDIIKLLNINKKIGEINILKQKDFEINQLIKISEQKL